MKKQLALKPNSLFQAFAWMFYTPLNYKPSAALKCQDLILDEDWVKVIYSFKKGSKTSYMLSSGNYLDGVINLPAIPESLADRPVKVMDYTYYFKSMLVMLKFPGPSIITIILSIAWLFWVVPFLKEGMSASLITNAACNMDCVKNTISNNTMFLYVLGTSLILIFCPMIYLFILPIIKPPLIIKRSLQVECSLMLMIFMLTAFKLTTFKTDTFKMSFKMVGQLAELNDRAQLKWSSVLKQERSPAHEKPSR
jgi:hypothetical protein